MESLIQHIGNIEFKQLLVELVVFVIISLILWRKGYLTLSSSWRELYEELSVRITHNEEKHKEQIEEYNDKLTKQLEAHQAQISEKEAEIQSLKRKVDTLDTELTSSRAENSQLRTINNKLQIINMEFSQKIALFKNDIEKLKQDVEVRQDAYEMASENSKMLRILLNDEEIRGLLARKKNETGSPEKHALIDKMTQTDMD